MVRKLSDSHEEMKRRNARNRKRRERWGGLRNELGYVEPPPPFRDPTRDEIMSAAHCGHLLEQWARHATEALTSGTLNRKECFEAMRRIKTAFHAFDRVRANGRYVPRLDVMIGRSESGDV